MGTRWRNELLHPEFEKNWSREAPSFANINLLGKCNVDCFFCLGKDIDPILGQQNQTKIHYDDWKKFDEFVALCKEKNVKRVYVTGQNTDSLLYKHLDSLVDHLQADGFDVGLRTNGYLAHRQLPTLQKCRRSVGLSIHTLDPDTNEKIMGRRDLPNWDTLIPQIPNVRVSIVLNRYNEHEAPELFKYLAGFNNVKYVQVRRICTDSRESFLLPDVEAYERVAEQIALTHNPVGEFYTAPIYLLHGKEFCFWRTVKTSIDSLNYFTDGTISDEYFVVEGYMRESTNFPKFKGIPIDAHGMGREGFWYNARKVA